MVGGAQQQRCRSEDDEVHIRSSQLELYEKRFLHAWPQCIRHKCVGTPRETRSCASDEEAAQCSQERKACRKCDEHVGILMIVLLQVAREMRVCWV